MRSLGAKGPIAIVGYTFDGVWAERNRSTVDRFLDATRQAKEILASSEAEWQRLAPRIRVTDPAALAIYRQRYSEGILRRPLADEEADARALYQVLAEVGGTELVGPARELDAGDVLPPGRGALSLGARLLSLVLLIAAWYAGSRIRRSASAAGSAIGRARDRRGGALGRAGTQPRRHARARRDRVHASPWRSAR